MSAIAGDYAVERDHRADERDRRADERDRRADERDDEAEAGDRHTLHVVLDLRDRRLTDTLRRQGADERRQAASDRAVAASDRAEAGLDRQAAAHERDDAEEERELSERDELTGVLQRGAGLVALEEEAIRSDRAGEPFVVAFIDVDGLKQVNDQRGHAAGDALLRTLGSTLRGASGAREINVRYGGDEFVCILPGVDLPTAAAHFALVQESLATAAEPVSVSVGLAASRPGESTDAVLARADAALYADRGERRLAQR